MNRKRTIIQYNSKLKEIAKELRKQGIYSEVLLWTELKGKKLLGYDFHRQKPIDEYIVDFYCSELMLAIEIDGSSHNHKQVYDAKRQKDLNHWEFFILRFKDSDVTKNVSSVVEHIKNWINGHTPSR